MAPQRDVAARLATGAVALVCLLSHAPFAPDLPANRDGIFFAGGVLDYSVVAHRPHWPGYPVYIWAGKLAWRFTGDPLQALRWVSLVATALLCLPLAALAGTAAAERAHPRPARVGLAAAALWTALPASWLDGTEMFSDPLGLLLLVGSLALLSRGARSAAGLLGGVMVGARLDYLLLLAPLLWARSARALALAALAASAWFGWQLAMDGEGWFRAASDALHGHVQSWGGSVATDPETGTRPIRLLSTFVRFEVGGWWPGLAYGRLLPGTLFLLALAVGGARLRATTVGRTLLLAGLPYLAWLLVGHSVDLSRYGLPLAAFATIVAANGLPRRGGIPGAVLVAALLTSAIPLAQRHVTLVPLGLQEVRFLRDHLEASTTVLLVTQPSPFLAWEAPGWSEEVLREGEQAAQVEALVASGRTVVATRSVLLRHHIPLHGWAPLADFAVDPEIVSRAPWDLHLYVRRP